MVALTALYRTAGQVVRGTDQSECLRQPAVEETTQQVVGGRVRGGRETVVDHRRRVIAEIVYAQSERGFSKHALDAVACEHVAHVIVLDAPLVGVVDKT